MPIKLPVISRSILAAAAALLIGRVTLSVVVGYRAYFPPDFQADFLLGRATYFWGPYAWAFYVHLFVGPATLLVGMLLMSDRFRRFAPRWHRGLGRCQIAGILLFLVPSGLWMAWYAVSGAVAGTGLAALALATAACAFLGWWAAVARRFNEHRIWMWRTYLLLCSAVVIRVVGGLAAVCQVDPPWLYPLSAWGSWLVPLVVFEVWRVWTTLPAWAAART
jgi:hypothetical protein